MFTLIDTQGKRLLPESYDNVRATTLNRVTFRTPDQKWGLLDGTTGRFLIKPEYLSMRLFHEPVTSAKNVTGHGLLHETEGPFGDWTFYLIGQFSEGLAAAIKTVETGEKKEGFIDATGAWIVPPVWGTAEAFSEGRAAVRGAARGTWGYVDTLGQLVISQQYVSANQFRQGIAFAYTDDWGGFIDTEGQILHEVEGSATFFSEGLCEYREPTDGANPRVCFIDLHFRQAFDRWFDEAKWFQEGIAPVRVKKKWGAIDALGNVVVPFQYDALSRCSQGLMAATLNKKDGYITRTGEIAIPFEYAGASDFNEFGIATVRLM